MKKFTVTHEDELLNYLFTLDLNMSKSKIKSLLKHDCIAINNKPTSQFNAKVEKGQVISIIPYNYRRNLPFDIIFEDEQLIVINKPHGMMTVGSDKKGNLSAFDHVQEYLQEKYKNNTLFVLHRLDRDTSGVLMFAKDKGKQQYLQNHWNQVVKRREYLAIIPGKMKPEQGTIKSLLAEDEKSTMVYSVAEDGKEAITHYKTIRANDKFSLLEVTLDTGRKNQIRVHLSEAGHPIIGDKKYFSKHNPIQRMGLHSRELIVGKQKFIAPTPRVFRNIVK